MTKHVYIQAGGLGYDGLEISQPTKLSIYSTQLDLPHLMDPHEQG